jgi:hypothetical protein
LVEETYEIPLINKAQKFIITTTLTNQNYIPEEIKSRLRSRNACYHSVQNLLSSRLLSKNLKITIYRTIILPVVLYGCEAWSLTLSEERKLRVFENMVLRRTFGPRRDEVMGNRGDCITRSMMICTPHPILCE